MLAVFILFVLVAIAESDSLPNHQHTRFAQIKHFSPNHKLTLTLLRGGSSESDSSESDSSDHDSSCHDSSDNDSSDHDSDDNPTLIKNSNTPTSTSTPSPLQLPDSIPPPSQKTVLTSIHLSSITLTSLVLLFNLKTATPSLPLVKFALLLAMVSCLISDPEGGILLTLPVGVVYGNENDMPRSALSTILESLRTKGYDRTFRPNKMNDVWTGGVGAGQRFAWSLVCLGFVLRSTSGLVAASPATTKLMLVPVLISSVAFFFASKSNPLRFLWFQLPLVSAEVIVAVLVGKDVFGCVVDGKGGAVEAVVGFMCLSYVAKRVIKLI